MALRTYDFLCRKCGNAWFEVRRRDPYAKAECCGEEAQLVVGAPGVKFRKPYFNRSLGVYIKDAAHEEAVLKNKNAFVPSKQDMFKAMDEDSAVGERPTFNKEKVEALAEKTYSQLRNEGQVRADGSDNPQATGEIAQRNRRTP